ncbi:PIG-L deacetylase family protein [Streptomyces mirabilis]|uniref:PIG-L deacetylase family protein n=1 Tax=Streptomyces mirabilis TaxID=68239 RepID=UPI0036DC1D82
MPDSADDIDPRAFSRMEGEPVVRRLEALMREYRPDAIVTYPPNGFSYHPDHARTHELTVAPPSSGSSGPADFPARRAAHASQADAAALLRLFSESDLFEGVRETP